MVDFQRAHLETLPASVVDLAIRLGANPDLKRTNVALTQTGRMKTSLQSTSWLSFTASQTISTRSCAFDWRAKAGPLGVIRVRDALEEGQGRLDVTVFGIIPIARAAHSLALLRGELMRYLAELAWAPDAILANTGLRWREDGPDRLVVAAGSNAAAVEVTLTLDTDGLISSAFAADRPRSVTEPFLPTPWQGHFSDYRRLETMLIPFAGEVAWIIDGVETIYWQGRIDEWTVSSG